MNRTIVLALALVLPFCAQAIEEKVVHLKGVTVTAIRSATRLCGMDFVISVHDGDQHLVKIDYSYNGTFKAPGAQDVPMNLWRGTRSDGINISVGRLTLEGNLAKVAALEFPNNSLVCREAWVFDFVASEYNASQQQRDDQTAAQQREQARLAEIERKRAEEAAKKRLREQQEWDRKQAEAKAKGDSLQAYKLENPRCIIVDRSDIALCEQWKARDREQRLKLQAEAVQEEKRLEQEKIAAARQAAQFKESDAQYERARADPCAPAAEMARRTPQMMQEHAAPTLQNAQAKAQWQQAQAAADAQCAASRNQAGTAAQPGVPQAAAPQPAAPQPAAPPPSQAQAQPTPQQQKIQNLLDLGKQLGVFK